MVPDVPSAGHADRSVQCGRRTTQMLSIGVILRATSTTGPQGKNS